MKLPLSWIKDYVTWNVTPEEFVGKLMWRGFEVSQIEESMKGITNVVVGKIAGIARHENSDHLLVCTIDAGGKEPISIVTGASNVFEGALVPVALDGATLAGGIEIHSTIMRGVPSAGMLCSGKELGLSEADYPGAEVNGIMILHEEHPLGQEIKAALGLAETVFTIELTPNRADCQSVIGMCREIAAALGQTFREPEIRRAEGEGHAADYACVSVLNPELCPRYCARVVTDLHIAPSPAWMQRRLAACGMRPINNIVDITNYVLLEYGHPMHAFDLACVANGHIVVRNAKEDEIVTTLDGKQRPVTPEMLLIADPEKGVGIAGVMGGLNSEITENTKATLFEAAVFKGSNIRATTRVLRHSTDAAARFIKGVEPVNAMLALERAVELVAELGAGKVVGETIDVCAVDTAERVIEVDSAHVNRILNTCIPAGDMVNMLATIGIAAKAQGDMLSVRVPHYRVDIESSIEAAWDIAEEIARIYGYYNIEPKLMEGSTFTGKVGEAFADEDMLKDLLVAQGFYEMYNYNFTGPAALEALRIPQGDEKRLAVALLNPFGEDQSLMRTTLLPGMLASLAHNLSHKTGFSHFFEVGNCHFDNNEDLPEERKLLGVLTADEDDDFFTLKGLLEEVASRMQIALDVKEGGGEYFQPGRRGVVYAGGEAVGEMGALHPAVCKAFEIDRPAYYAEINMAKLLRHKGPTPTYQALPKFPKVERDIAVLVDEAVSARQAQEVIAQTRLKVLLEDIVLFDVYRGAGIPAGKKSMAFSFTLRAEDHTLADEEIQAAMALVVRALQARLKAELRG